MTGLRAGLAISETAACPVAAFSEQTDGPVRGVEWTGGDGAVVERFTVAGDDPGGVDSATDDRAVAETRPVYADEETNGCVCELIEATGCPVESVKARDGQLTLTVHARSRERLKTVIEAARDAAGSPTASGKCRRRPTNAATSPTPARRTPRAWPPNSASLPPFREHLAAAQSKLFDTLVG